MVEYASTQKCRNIQLLNYFDEHNASKCGVCDVCLAEKLIDDIAQLDERIDFEVVSLLQQQHLGLDDLVQSLRTGTEENRIDAIRELLDAGKIKTDGKKYYL